MQPEAGHRNLAGLVSLPDSDQPVTGQSALMSCTVQGPRPQWGRHSCFTGGKDRYEWGWFTVQQVVWKVPQELMGVGGQLGAGWVLEPTGWSGGVQEKEEEVGPMKEKGW